MKRHKFNRYLNINIDIEIFSMSNYIKDGWLYARNLKRRRNILIYRLILIVQC